MQYYKVKNQASVNNFCEIYVKILKLFFSNDKIITIYLKMGGKILIKVENVTKKYGKYVALSDMNFEIKEGEIVRIFRT